MTSPPEESSSRGGPHGRWRRLRRGWLAGPVVLLVLPLAIGYVIAHSLLDLSVGNDALRPERLVTRLVFAALGAVVLAVVIRRMRSRPGAGPDGLELTEAVEDGRLPAGADLEAWTGALLRRRATVEAEVARTQLLMGGALVVGGVVWGALGGPWVVWLAVGALSAILVALRAAAPRRLARIDALLMPLLDAEDEAGSRT
ncbi:hypothetical protein [Clavibacter capsici]|uniref:Uncharacterized protein n=1 Tax=Clavibacter capsici TaxID=1874630 RepID=A0AAE6XR59_9MICO|nr:hypothetical protein [Clavibacter capsici]ALD13092.1 hypothetical protein AES38_09330 [Clavibacter capsici]QIS45279.1 hypothetical protein GW570_09365 [Clavibacter capsici]